MRKRAVERLQEEWRAKDKLHAELAWSDILDDLRKNGPESLWELAFNVYRGLRGFPCYALLIFMDKLIERERSRGMTLDERIAKLKEAKEALETEIKELSKHRVAKDEPVEPAPKRTGWEKPTNNSAYYTIEGNCVHATLRGMEVDNAPGEGEAYAGANCFTNHALAERIAKQQTVLRLLQRFSDEHGGQEIGKTTAQAWYIAYGKVLDFSKEKDGRVPAIKELYAHSGSPGQGVVPGVVLFATEKVCQQAIEKYGNQIKDAWGLVDKQ